MPCDCFASLAAVGGAVVGVGVPIVIIVFVATIVIVVGVHHCHPGVLAILPSPLFPISTHEQLLMVAVGGAVYACHFCHYGVSEPKSKHRKIS
jgi:hypothetical protein